MKFRVIFLKRKYIYFITILLALLILFVVFLFSKNSKPSFNNIVNNDKVLKCDLNGDGLEDSLSVKQQENKYMLQAKIKDKTYDLNTGKNLNQFGTYSAYWPMKITLMDVSRDKIPEIFIQSSNMDNPMQHIFIWNDGKFENVFSNNNNILGFVDCKNNKTPKVISGNLGNDNIWMNYYMFLNYKFKNYNYECSNTFMGKDTIVAFIKFIQGLPSSEPSRPKEIFESNLIDSDLPSISKLCSENRTYIFQDAMFTENKCNQDGEVCEISWTLNFRGISTTDKKDIKNYNLSLLLVRNEYSKEKNYFKITSLK